MKKYAVIILMFLSLIACTNHAHQTENNFSTDKKKSEIDLVVKTSEDDHSNAVPSIENEDEAENDDPKKDEESSLSKFSSEEIEYARVWLQLGDNRDIEELNATLISAGEPLNPNDETSANANYPEDVVQLAGSRLVDGSITYSSNGDGTINVYNVPLRWDGQYPAGEEFYKGMIENTILEEIDRGEDKHVIDLITVLQIHE